MSEKHHHSKKRRLKRRLRGIGLFIKDYKEFFIFPLAIIIVLVIYRSVTVIDFKKENKASKYNEIIAIESGNISEIKVVNPDESYTIVYDAETYISEFPESKIDASAVSNFRQDIAFFGTSEDVFENVSDLSEYGLSEPTCYAEISEKNGNKTYLYIGNKIPAQERYYCSVNDKKNVYVIGNYIPDVLSRDSNFYRITEFEEIDFNDVSEMELEIYGKYDMKFKEAAVSAANNSHNVFDKMMMTEPYNWPAMSTEVGKIVESVSNIDILSYELDNEENREKFGFSPYTAKIIVVHNGKTDTFLIGGEEENKLYLISDKHKTIYGIYSKNFDYLTHEPFGFVSDFAFLKNIDTVKNIIYNHNGTETSFEIIRTEGSKYNVKKNGKPMIQKDFQKLYEELIGIKLDGGYEGGINGEPFLKLTFDYTDGTSETVEYYKVDDSRAAFSANGKVQFYSSIASLDSKLSVIEGIINQ